MTDGEYNRYPKVQEFHQYLIKKMKYWRGKLTDQLDHTYGCTHFVDQQMLWEDDLAQFNREVMGIQNDNDLNVDKPTDLSKSLKDKKGGKKGKKNQKWRKDDDLVSKSFQKTDDQISLLQLYT